MSGLLGEGRSKGEVCVMSYEFGTWRLPNSTRLKKKGEPSEYERMGIKGIMVQVFQKKLGEF